MFIINGKSQASTVRLAVGTGCVHQEIGYCLTGVSCHVTCRTDEDLKAWSARSLFDSPSLLSFAYYSTVYLTWHFFFSESILKFILQTKNIKRFGGYPAPCSPCSSNDPSILMQVQQSPLLCSFALHGFHYPVSAVVQEQKALCPMSVRRSLVTQRSVPYKRYFQRGHIHITSVIVCCYNCSVSLLVINLCC